MDQGPKPREQTVEDRTESAGDRFLKTLGIDPNKWTVGDRRLALLAIVVALTIVIIAVCGYTFGWEWTGLAKRTFWDWLSLLIVPSVLALGGYFFTRSENRRTREAADEQRTLDRQIADEQRTLDRQIADQRRQDDTLLAYLDGMSQLLTDKDRPLHRAPPGDRLRTVARARTLTVLPRLDGDHKARAVQFLYESGLVDTEQRIVDITAADLGGANLIEANLSRAYLGEANLSRAYLGGTNLFKAYLGGANLFGANLSRANLSEANLFGANLFEADLFEADLSGANLGEADLGRAILGVANLSGANLSGANLFKAYLGGANLGLAYLVGADLGGANLGEANLVGADLRYADLRGAVDITNEKLDKQPSSLQGATMPNGQPYEAWLKDREGRK